MEHQQHTSGFQTDTTQQAMQIMETNQGPPQASDTENQDRLKVISYEYNSQVSIINSNSNLFLNSRIYILKPRGRPVCWVG